jgi:hypothetical protein
MTWRLEDRRSRLRGMGHHRRRYRPQQRDDDRGVTAVGPPGSLIPNPTRRWRATRTEMGVQQGPVAFNGSFPAPSGVRVARQRSV